jgi:hypothetical protein
MLVASIYLSLSRNRNYCWNVLIWQATLPCCVRGTRKETGEPHLFTSKDEDPFYEFGNILSQGFLIYMVDLYLAFISVKFTVLRLDSVTDFRSFHF